MTMTSMGAQDHQTMSSRPKPSWTGYQLIWGVLATNKKHSPTYGLDSETEILVIVLEEPQKAADCTRTPKQVNILSIELRILCEYCFDCRFHGVTWVASGVWVFEVLPGVLRELCCFCARVPDCWHAFGKWSVRVEEVLLDLLELTREDDRWIFGICPVVRGEELGVCDL
jgi:hypothetical protein